MINSQFRCGFISVPSLTSYLFCCLFLSFRISTCIASIVTVYSGANFTGASQELNLTDISCISSDSGLHLRNINSVNVGEYCANLWTSENCEGSYYIIKPGTTSHSSLSAVSIGPCYEACHEYNIETRDVTILIELYSKENYTGDTFAYNVTLDNCVTIPLRMSNRTASVKFQRPDESYTSVFLYTGWDCEGDSIRVARSSPSLTEDHGSKYHNWGQSFSFYGYQCRDGLKKIVTPDSNEVPEKGFKYAVIHRFPNFKGQSHFVTIPGAGCSNLDEFWRAKANSLEVHANCVRIFENTNCVGIHYDLQSSLNDLKIIDFSEKMQSLGVCGPEPKICEAGTTTTGLLIVGVLLGVLIFVIMTVALIFFAFKFWPDSGHGQHKQYSLTGFRRTLDKESHQLVDL